MALILNEEQKMLKDSANEFLATNAPVEQFRTLRDNNYEAFDPDLWPAMVEMGWTALTIPEEYNGLDFGYVGLGQVLEEMGRNLTKAPLLSSIVLGGTALVNSTNAGLKSTWIPAIMNGNKRIAFAQDEKNYFDPSYTCHLLCCHKILYCFCKKKTVGNLIYLHQYRTDFQR